MWTETVAPMLGWLAAILTLGTFACEGGQRLRVAALSANAAFVAYGLTAGLLPVLALHIVLIPINLWRLACARRARPAVASIPAPNPTAQNCRLKPAQCAYIGRRRCRKSMTSRRRSVAETWEACRARPRENGTPGGKAHLTQRGLQGRRCGPPQRCTKRLLK